MEVICLEEAAFFSLIEKVVERLKEKTSASVGVSLAGCSSSFSKMSAIAMAFACSMFIGRYNKIELKV